MDKQFNGRFLLSLMAVCFFTSTLFARVSFKELRDKEIIKQNQDYSCGAAAVATLLTYSFQDPTTEEEVLRGMNKTATASFADLKQYIEKKGYQVRGLASSLFYLEKLEFPVIGYLVIHGKEHFTVIKRVERGKVWLADPSFGNQMISEYRFLDFFKTRSDPLYCGKILEIAPKKPYIAPSFPSQNAWKEDLIFYFRPIAK